MDAHTLLQCFAGTLEPSQAVRLQAEQQLRQQALSPGFLGACLDVIAASGESPGLQKAAAVYFKNRVVRHWTDAGAPIDSGEKPVVLDRFVGVLAGVKATAQTQLLPVFRTLVAAEYPRNWPRVLAEVGALLQQHDDVAAVRTGAMCFAELCRSYRWTENREREAELDPIISQVFPHLLAVGDAVLLLDVSELTAAIVKHILKAYKFVTYFDMPRVLQLKDALAAWGDFHCRVACLDAPAYLRAAALDLERAQTQLARCHKWAVANMERLFRRYASRGLSLKRDMAGFRRVFVADFIPHVVAIYLDLLGGWCRGERWLSSAAVYHVLDFLSHCVTQKEAWRLLEPCFEDIVAHFVLPVLCPSAATLELFDVDPADYINSKLDNFDDLEPDVAALGLLVTLVLKRKKTTAAPIVALAVRQLAALKAAPAGLENARHTDGALRLVGGISHVLTAAGSPYLAQMEAFMAEFVLPHLDSAHDFLRARALDVCAKLADVSLQDPATVQALYRGILRAFTAGAGDAVCLPVLLQSALAVQAYLPQQLFREALAPLILPAMAKLLELSNEIDNEAVSVVMQECVESFAPQLQPFGIDLMASLVAQFLRLAAEIKDAAAVEPDDYDADHSDALSDKITAALGLLNTMITVLLSFENSHDVCVQLEQAFAPVIEYVLVHQLDDFIAEIGELIENSIFLLRAVTPLMWSHFPRLVDLFLQGVAVMYAEDMVPCLKNYMVFGAAALAHSPPLTAKFMLLIALISSGDDGSPDYTETALACDLGQTLVLALQQASPPVIAELCRTLLPVLAPGNDDPAHRNDSLRISLVDFLIACLMYDCPTTVRMLQESQYLDAFFDLWLGLVPQPKRVYDVKLFILGFMRISNSPDVAAAAPSLTSRVGPSLAALFKELPKALKNLDKQRAEFNENDFVHDDAFGADFADFDDNDALDSDNADAGDAGDAGIDNYRAFLDHETNKLMGSGFEDDDQIIEDVLGATPLDNVDPVVVFRDFATSLQENNPPLYAAIFDNISDSDRQVLVDVFKTQ
ncbi:ARM repeat-containing protein [Metschnikowia bicuspidata var. bicuspidata NRRL YB-4993]|uniref:ARM repeat-containing protein n=1 Tax=Metschnikowia bicuspidata var. bicuspidata NRRL YB-4993 TaxID=869754 RepID=A0A1A0HFX3_9ASCO|nr:ARM repeat-containing protein [Metschnikowia bicuspidata var. bicuspidata NRRL YB-4993]OBA23059.1 ARM repeat-containing protein [Metschnikowia bicuspidata var. bicuspidata NRRL YB-4993]